MRFKLKRLGILSVIIILVVALIGSSLTQGGFSSFKLNKLAFQDLELPDAFCYFKTKTEMHDENNVFLRSDSSPFFTGAPKFSLVDLMSGGAIVGTFRTSVLMACDTGIGSTSPNTPTLIVKPSTLKIQVLSKDSRNHLIETFVDTKLTDRRALTNGNEFLIAKFVIPVEQVIKKLDTGSYDSLQEFRVSGTVLLFYEGFDFPAVTYSFTIPTTCSNPFKCPNTFIELAIRDNTIGQDPDTTPPIVEPEPTPTPTGEADPNDPSGKNIDISDIATEFSQCLILGDLPCLQQSKFFFFYGIGTVFVILGVVASMGRRQEQFRVIEG